MTEKTSTTQPLTDSQIQETFQELSSKLQRKPTLTELDKTLKGTFGVSVSRNRLVKLTREFASATLASVTALSAELQSSVETSILKFVNHEVEAQTQALKDRLQCVEIELVDAAREIDEREGQLKSIHGRMEHMIEVHVGLQNLVITRNEEIESLKAQLSAKESGAALVYAQQIAEKIEENLKLHLELDTVKERFIAQLTTLVGASKAVELLDPSPCPQELSSGSQDEGSGS